jgi:hypothetical protein
MSHAECSDYYTIFLFRRTAQHVFETEEEPDVESLAWEYYRSRCHGKLMDNRPDHAYAEIVGWRKGDLLEIALWGHDSTSKTLIRRVTLLYNPRTHECRGVGLWQEPDGPDRE